MLPESTDFGYLTQAVDYAYTWAQAQDPKQTLYVPTLPIQWGENAMFDDQAPETFIAHLQTIRDAYEAHVQSKTNDPATIVASLSQVASHEEYSVDPHIAIAQAALARSSDKFAIFPLWPYDTSETVGMPHLAPETSKVAGFHHADIAETVMRGERYQHLDLVRVTRQGPVALAEYRVPTLPLVLDDRGGSGGTYGFEMVTSGGTPITVSSVSLVADGALPFVKIVCDSNIPAGAKLRTQWQGEPGTDRPGLRDSTATVFDPTGINVPGYRWQLIDEMEVE
jgi:hypothetical protein